MLSDLSQAISSCLSLVLYLQLHVPQLQPRALHVNAQLFQTVGDWV